MTTDITQAIKGHDAQDPDAPLSADNYPQVAGPVEVPAIPVEVTTKGWGPNTDEKVEQASTPAVTILSKIPPGAGNVRGLVSSPRLMAEQEWMPSNKELKVGNALERTVTLQADDISAMSFMPLQHDVIPGVGTYPAEPDLKDTADRGSLTGWANTGMSGCGMRLINC